MLSVRFSVFVFFRPFLSLSMSLPFSIDLASVYLSICLSVSSTSPSISLNPFLLLIRYLFSPTCLSLSALPAPPSFPYLSSLCFPSTCFLSLSVYVYKPSYHFLLLKISSYSFLPPIPQYLPFPSIVYSLLYHSFHCYVFLFPLQFFLALWF